MNARGGEQGRRPAGRLAAGLVLAAGLAAYSNSFGVPFQFDDAATILHDGLVQDLPGALRALPRHPRGVGVATLAANVAVHGFDVFGFHVVNLAVHLATALLVYALARWTLVVAGCDGALGALGAALLFAVHPLQTQAVTYIVQRHAALAALFYVAALLLYARSRLAQGRRAALLYAGALAAAFLAVRSKETAATLPAAILLYEVVFLRSPGLARRAALVAPFALVALLIPAAHLGANAGDLEAATRVQTSMPRATYLLTELRVVVLYLRLLVYPVGQSIDHDVPASAGFGPEEAACGALLGALALTGGALARRWGAAAVAGFGILFGFLALSVESSLVPIIDVAMEHRMYLPMVGIALAAGAAVELLPARRAVAAVALATVLLAGATFARNRVWSSPAALWLDAALQAPRKLRPLLNLGQALADAGHGREAWQVWSRALEIAPTSTDELFARGDIRRQAGDEAGARADWLQVIEADPRHARALNNLGIFAFLEGDEAAALSYFERAVRAQPLLPSARANLSAARAALGLPAP